VDEKDDPDQGVMGTFMNGQLYPYFLMGVTFICFAMITYGVASYSYSRRNMKERYRSSEAKTATLIRGEGPRSFKKQILGWLAGLGKMTIKNKVEEIPLQLKSTLFQAGFRHPNASAVYFGLRTLCAFVLPLPFIFLNIWRGKSASSCLMIAFLIAATGYFLPSYVLQVVLRKRQDRIDRALPDVLDLMIVSMEAGLALQATFIRVAEEVRSISKDLYKELQITNAELRTGISREAALKNLAERNGVQSLKSLVGLMVQSEKMGTSITEALRTHADFIRVKRSQKAEEVAAKLPVKILFPMMLFIMPALFIVVLGPGAIQISRTLLK
jgi:tight adherence protein C